MRQRNANIISAILANKEGFAQVSECIEKSVYFIIPKYKTNRYTLYAGTFTPLKIYNCTLNAKKKSIRFALHRACK